MIKEEAKKGRRSEAKVYDDTYDEMGRKLISIWNDYPIIVLVLWFILILSHPINFSGIVCLF